MPFFLFSATQKVRNYKTCIIIIQCQNEPSHYHLVSFIDGMARLKKREILLLLYYLLLWSSTFFLAHFPKGKRMLSWWCPSVCRLIPHFSIIAYGENILAEMFSMVKRWETVKKIWRRSFLGRVAICWYFSRDSPVFLTHVLFDQQYVTEMYWIFDRKLAYVPF